MFKSPLGTWIPLIGILTATYLAGLMTVPKSPSGRGPV